MELTKKRKKMNKNNRNSIQILNDLKLVTYSSKINNNISINQINGKKNTLEEINYKNN